MLGVKPGKEPGGVAGGRTVRKQGEGLRDGFGRAVRKSCERAAVELGVGGAAEKLVDEDLPKGVEEAEVRGS